MTDLERYQYRRSIGLCGRSGCDTWSDAKSLCPRHLEAQRKASAMRRHLKVHGARLARVLAIKEAACSRRRA